MRWLPHISFSSPSSSSASSLRASSSCSESPDRDRDTDRGRNRRVLRILGPKLTRQKKLRHLAPLDLLGDRPQLSSSSVTAAQLSRSPSECAGIRRSKSVAVPLPLPLPMPEGGSGVRLPARKNSVHSKGGDRDRADCGAEKASSSSSPRGAIASERVARKKPDKLDVRSHTTSQEVSNSSSPNDGYWINLPTRSAPSSPIASPLPSPHRKSAGDMFPYFNMPPRGNQVWSAPEMPFAASGLPPAFMDYTTISTDNSPINSPRQFARSPSASSAHRDGVSSPLHPRLSTDVSGVRRENAIVHPLPLPPGAGLTSPSTSNPQIPSKQEPFPRNSQWQKGKLIGRGTFGSVYVASNRETGALCAMKEVEMLPDDPKSAECIKQLEQEIKLLSQLQHPNIVQYYGSEIVDDKFYIYLEYVHPGSISKYVREHFGAITESVVRSFTRHILTGLAYLHSKKTVHRDIKGANLLVDAFGVVKLADFGTAKHLTGQRADLSMKGSPYWMAPELMQAVMQKDNSSDLAFAIDIWSLGCTIIEIVTGKPPWSDFEGAAAMFKVMKDTPPIPESLSPEAKNFLGCCFKRNPAERPTAAMLLEHRFLKNSQQPYSPRPDVQSCSQLFNGMKLTDKAPSRRDRSPEIKHAQMHEQGSRCTNKARITEIDTEQHRVHRETHPDATMGTSRHSPRSTLEAILSPSPPRSSSNIRAEKNDNGCK